MYHEQDFVFIILFFCVDQAGLEIRTLLPQPLSARITRVHHSVLPTSPGQSLSFSLALNS